MQSGDTSIAGPVNATCRDDVTLALSSLLVGQVGNLPYNIAEPIAAERAS
jgi:hypothetical protein